MAAIWESHKDTLRNLYITRGETLRSIMDYMRELHGFSMSKGQYERQFKKWGFCKNSKAEIWKTIGRKVALRQTQGKESVVRRDGEVVSQEKLSKERRHASALDLLQPGNLASTPDGFTVDTPQYDAMPWISINNLPSLKLFSLLRLHIDSINVLFGRSNQDLVSRMADYDINRASALVQCVQWVHRLASDRYQNLYNASDSTTFEIDIPSELSSISRAGANSRLLLSIIHSAANKLLSEEQASDMLSTILQNSNRKLFQALIAGQSPATKAIARTFLSGAIESLDCSLVRALLDTGISPDSYVDERRRRPLQIAIARQSMEMVHLLLDRGADVNVHFPDSGHVDSPLKVAVQTGRLDLVQLLLRAGTYVNDLEPRHRTQALIVAADTGQLQLVQLLLDAGANVHAPPKENFGRTALQAAAGAGNPAVVQLLISHGVDVNAPRERYGRTALENAAHSDNIEITQLLLFYGATDAVSALEIAGQWQHDRTVNHLIDSWMTTYALLDDGFGRTALRAATQCGDFELVRKLLDCGAPTDGDTIRHTSLQIAAHDGDIKISELLLSYGADINAPAMPRSGFSQGTATALQEAVDENHMQLVPILLDHGANVNAPAARGRRTALAAAARHNNWEIFRLLLDHGADMKDQGASVAIAAIGNASLEFLRFLLNTWTDASGGNLEWTVNHYHETALEIAAMSRDTELARLLLEYEANDSSLALREAIKCDTDSINMEVVELLLASGAEVGYLDGDGDGYDPMTALDSAAYANHLDALRLFLERQTTAHERAQALQVAAYGGKLDAVQLLLDHGADINAAPFAGLTGELRTALQAAAGEGDLEMVRFLLEAGADVESKVPSEDEQGTALQFATIAGSMSVVILLIQEGANVFAPAIGEDGRTALEGAAEHGRLDIVQLLLSLGVEAAGSRAIQFAREEGHDGVVALLEESSKSCSLTGTRAFPNYGGC